MIYSAICLLKYQNIYMHVYNIRNTVSLTTYLGVKRCIKLPQM